MLSKLSFGPVAPQNSFFYPVFVSLCCLVTRTRSFRSARDWSTEHWIQTIGLQRSIVKYTSLFIHISEEDEAHSLVLCCCIWSEWN